MRNQSNYLKLLQEFEDTINCKINKFAFYDLVSHAKKSPMSNSMSEYSRKYFYNMFVPSKGKLPIAINNVFKNFSNNNVDKLTSYKKNQDLIDKLDNDGYAVIENFLEEDQIDQIKNELNGYNYYSPSNHKIRDKLSNIKKDEQYKKISTFHSLINGKPLEFNSPIQKYLINNNFFSEISNQYFGIKSYLNMLVSFYSNPIKSSKANEEDFRNGLFYHIDYSHLRFLKFFIYLTDVDSPSKGSHSIIKKTHEQNMIYPKTEDGFVKNSIREFPNGARGGVIKNEWIKENVNEEDLIDFNHKKGSLMIENTTALHKGNFCFEGNREMISLIFSISNVCPHVPKDSILIKNEKKLDFSDYRSYCFENFSQKHEKNFLKKNNFRNKILFKIFNKL